MRAKLCTEVSGSIARYLPQGVIAPLCFMKEGLDILVATRAENIAHVTKWVIARFPLEFDEDLCFGRVRHPRGI